MYSESSVASPEDLDCYEECVVSDEVYLSSSPTGSVCTPSALSDSPSRSDRIPKSNSGRITKKSETNIIVITITILMKLRLQINDLVVCIAAHLLVQASLSMVELWLSVWCETYF